MSISDDELNEERRQGHAIVDKLMGKIGELGAANAALKSSATAKAQTDSDPAEDLDWFQ